MALRPIRQPWQKAGFKTQAAYRSSPAFRRLQTPKPLAPPKIPQIRMGYNPRQRPGQFYSNPSQLAPWSTTADLNTVQGNIDAGYMAWDPSLGKLGYKPPARRTTAGTYDTGPSVEQTTPLTDYGALIAGDYEVQGAEAMMGSQMARARGDFQSQLRQAFIDQGYGDTSKLGAFGKYIDADTIKASVANKYSATAQNQQEATRASASNNAALAARGILSSGQTTKSATDVTAAQETANYQGLRSFLEGGQQGLTGLADMESGLAQQIAAARANAAGRAAAFGPGGEGTGVDQYGNPVGTPTTAEAKARAQRAMLTRRQFLAKPVRAGARGRTANQRYQNYLNAYRRQNR